MTFKVTKIIDGDTFDVTPAWKWKGHQGNRVRPTGYNAAEAGEPGYQQAKDRLADLILGKNVELKNPVDISYGRLLCDVYFNGRNLTAYLPVYE